jgi:hypothetical protein
MTLRTMFLLLLASLPLPPVWGEHAFAAQYGGQAGQARSGERTSDIGLYYSADSQ